MTRAVAEYPIPEFFCKAVAARLLTFLLATVVAVACLCTTAFAAPPKGGAANIAMVGEPQTLDPMASPPPTWSARSCSTSTSRCTPSTPTGTWCRCWPRACRRSRTTAWSTRITLRKGVKLHNGATRRRRRRRLPASAGWRCRRAARRWPRRSSRSSAKGPTRSSSG